MKLLSSWLTIDLATYFLHGCYRSRMDSLRGRTWSCLWCHQWERSRSVPLRISAPSSQVIIIPLFILIVSELIKALSYWDGLAFAFLHCGFFLFWFGKQNSRGSAYWYEKGWDLIFIFAYLWLSLFSFMGYVKGTVSGICDPYNGVEKLAVWKHKSPVFAYIHQCRPNSSDPCI